MSSAVIVDGPAIITLNSLRSKKLGKAGELDGSSAADILGLEEDNSDT